MPVLLADSEVVDCGGRFKGNNGDALKKVPPGHRVRFSTAE
jgi:hypothetical protein